jgi:acetyl-CoA carboxylase biotin carboxyl carrier protein
MDLSYIKKLIELLKQNDLEEIEISSWGKKIKIAQRLYHPSSSKVQKETPQTAVQEEIQKQIKEENIFIVKSPIVGTFYSAPSPDEKPYVQKNDSVSKGQVLCIVEAMKLMNEIECEVNGKILEIQVENSKPVEFGQPLFKILMTGE